MTREDARRINPLIDRNLEDTLIKVMASISVLQKPFLEVEPEFTSVQTTGMYYLMDVIDGALRFEAENLRSENETISQGRMPWEED